MESRLARSRWILLRAFIRLSSIARIFSLMGMVVYTIAQLLYLALPLYVFSGDVEGYIGILSYRLNVFGHYVGSPHSNPPGSYRSQ